jgi:DNA-binding NtrC family response regulator
MRMLIVEHDDVLRGAIVREAESQWSMAASAAATLREGLAMLVDEPDLVVFALRLPDGNGLAIADRANAHAPVPHLLAMIEDASFDEAFALARKGVRHCLAKPISLDELRDTALRAVAPPTLGPLAAQCVGAQSLHDVIAGVRHAMLEQALARAKGNRTVAAEMLGITRQAVQQMLRESGASRLDISQKSRMDGAQVNLR